MFERIQVHRLLAVRPMYSEVHLEPVIPLIIHRGEFLEIIRNSAVLNCIQNIRELFLCLDKNYSTGIIGWCNDPLGSKLGTERFPICARDRC